VADEYKALTVINLPFTDYSYLPGAMIPRSAFDECAEATAAAFEKHPDTIVPTAQEMIDDMSAWGSLSDDPEAELHPDHIPVDPGLPTIAQMIEQAHDLVEDLENRGQDVPDELRQLANTEWQHVTSTDAGEAGDKHAG